MLAQFKSCFHLLHNSNYYFYVVVDRVLIFDLFTLNKPYCHVKPPVKVQICIKYIKLNIASHKTSDGKSQLFDVLSHKSHQNLANRIIVHGSSEMEGRGRIPSEAMNVTPATLEKSLQGGKQSESVKSTVVIILQKKLSNTSAPFISYKSFLENWFLS